MYDFSHFRLTGAEKEGVVQKIKVAPRSETMYNEIDKQRQRQGGIYNGND